MLPHMAEADDSRKIIPELFENGKERWLKEKRRDHLNFLGITGGHVLYPATKITIFHAGNMLEIEKRT